jgi:hypothetical protein
MNDPSRVAVSYASIWSITLELSITILEALFSLIYDVNRTGITIDDQIVFIVNKSKFKTISVFVIISLPVAVAEAGFESLTFA